MNLITLVVLCLIKEIFHSSGRVINKFMSKSEKSISAKEDIQWRKLSSQNLLNIVRIGGTHAVCVCNINQNVNLMMIGGNILC